MFINILMAAAISSSSVGMTEDNNLPFDVSSKIALYLLVSSACDEMVDSNVGPAAKAKSASILQGYGFSGRQVDSMFDGFIAENLESYIAAVSEASDNNETAIRYFCSSTIKQKREMVEEIERHPSN